MKRSISCIILILIMFFTGSLDADEYPGWSGYPPVFSMNDVIEFGGNVYGATKGGMFRYDPLLREYKLYYKNHGLISNNVLCIGATSQKIYIGIEENGLWRFDPETEEFQQIIFPEYHIKNTSNPNGISVRDIFTKNDSTLYIGHSEGVDKLTIYPDGDGKLRTFTKLGPSINEGTAANDVKVFGGKIWVCTDFGLAVADEDNPDLEFKASWSNYHYYSDPLYNVINVADGAEEAIYIGTDKKILLFEEDTGTFEIRKVTDFSVLKFVENSGIYWAITKNNLYRKYAKLWKMLDESITGLTCVAGGTGSKIWIGTIDKGLQCYTTLGYILIPPESDMKSFTFYDIDISPDNVLWAATSYRDQSLDSVFQRLQGDEWTSYNEADFPDLRPNLTVATLADSHSVIWMATWGKGLYITYDDGTTGTKNDLFARVDPTNRIIRPTIASFCVICTELAEDIHGNIWIANFQSDPPDHKLEAIPTSGAVVINGYPIEDFEHYSPADDGLPTAMIFVICPDEDGWVWCGTWDRGLIGIYVGDDPFDKSDSETHVLTMEDGLHAMKINAVDYDSEGFVWVGTKSGLNRISKHSGKNLQVEDMNEKLGDVTGEIRAIEIDKHNNKWIGTEGGGLIKINAKNEYEKVFTNANSGLFSDVIFSLKYDGDNDILWVGTDIGLNKYDLSTGQASKDSLYIHVYPNPFEIWGYNSRAVFNNLKQDSTIRIYSFTKNLINEFTAFESYSDGEYKVEWNGKNFEGNFVGSGIYFFTGVDKNGEEFKEKMVVVRR